MMGYFCDLCGKQRSTVYCQADAAGLCLPCDQLVHSANKLCGRHSRTLICGRCYLQPAIFKCSEENISLCQNCDLFTHDSSTAFHVRCEINTYSGCPSASELSIILPSVSYLPSLFPESYCKQDDVLVPSSLNMHQATESVISKTQRLGIAETQSVKCHPVDDDQIIEGINFGVCDYIINNSRELLNMPEEQLFETKETDIFHGWSNYNISTEVTNTIDSYGATGLACVPSEVIQPESSSILSADSLTSFESEPICFRLWQNDFNIPYSGPNQSECVAINYENNDLSSILSSGNKNPNCSKRISPSTSRDMAILRYRVKKKKRN